MKFSFMGIQVYSPKYNGLKMFFGVFSFTILITWTVSLSFVSASIIYVPDNFSKIGWAVDNATDFDTVVVRDGIYTENIDVIKSNITITSENGSVSCMVRALSINDDVFRINAKNTTLNGFTVEGANGTNCGNIYLFTAEKVNITNNSVYNGYYGIISSNSTDNIISHNFVNSSQYGISVWGVYSSNNVIRNNNVSQNNGYGVYVEDSDNISVKSNVINNNQNHGVYIRSANGTDVMGNDIKKNGGDGIYIFSSNVNSICYNEISNNLGYGIYLYPYSNYNTVRGNIIKNSGNWGLRLYSSDNNIVSDNTLEGNSGHNVRLYLSSHNFFDNNTLRNSSNGMYFDYSGFNTINGTKVSGTTNGLEFRVSSNNEITNNSINTNSYSGLILSSNSNYNNVSYNHIRNNDRGIIISSSSENVISYNNISDSDYRGLTFSSSSNNNKIYLNNFINNLYNVYSSVTQNSWHTDVAVSYQYNGLKFKNYLGNYWDDYTGSDLNVNGIGDTPYEINSDQDEYPLVSNLENYTFISDLSLAPKLYYPHVHDDNSWRTYFSVVNTNDTSHSNIELKFLNNFGTYRSSNFISLLPLQKFSDYANNVVGSNFIGTIKTESDKSVFGMLYFRDNSQNVLGCYETTAPNNTLYFPHVHDGSGWRSYFSVMNTADTNASVQLKFYDNNKVLVKTHSINLLPNEKFSDYPINVVGSSFVGTLRAESDQPIVGMLNFRDDSSNVLGTYSTKAPNNTLYFPHVHDGSGWRTYFSVLNVGSSNASVSLKFYDNGGSLIAIKTMSLTPNEKFSDYANNVVGSDFVGTLRAESDQPIVGMLNFRDNAKNIFGTYSTTNPQTTIHFPYAKDGGGWVSYFSVMNVGTQNATVQIKFYNNTGVLVHTGSVNLTANEKFSGYPRNLVGSDFEGTIIAESDQPIVGMLNLRDDAKRMFDSYTGG